MLLDVLRFVATVFSILVFTAASFGILVFLCCWAKDVWSFIKGSL